MGLEDGCGGNATQAECEVLFFQFAHGFTLVKEEVKERKITGIGRG